MIPIVLLAMCPFISPVFCLAQQPAAAHNSGDQKAQLCTIGGTVVSANTGEPLKKAHVVLSQKGAERDDSNEHALGATTDAAGHFSIDRIPAGSYDLVVRRNDYLPARYGQDRLDKPGATLSLAPGQKIMDLLFGLHRMGIVAGRITDEDGDPVRDAAVDALLHTSINGKLKIHTKGSVTTNDLGEYRIFDLEPGRYSIRATAGESSHTIIAGPSQEADNYLPTYYSGTTDSARASTLEVKSGDEISGVDFVLAPRASTRTFKIHGRVLISLTEHSEEGVFVTALHRENRELSFEDRRETRADTKTGDFEIQGLVPGEYALNAIFFAVGKIRTASQIVEVINTDVDGVSLVLTRGIDIAGRVVFEGKSARSTADVRVWLEPAEGETIIFGSGGQQAEVQPDGSFVLKEVGDGSYSVEIHSKCGECYIKSAKADGVDLLDQGLQVASGAVASPIAIVYSSDTGVVNGAVTNKDDLPAPGAMVVLVPASASHQKLEEYKTSTTDQYGHFEIRGVPPGHYKAFAWEKVDAGSYGDPDFLRPFESMAASFDLAGNEQKTVQLKMIPAAD